MIFHVMCSIEIYTNRKTLSTHKGSGIIVGGGLSIIDILCGFQVTSVQHQANFPVDTNPNTVAARAYRCNICSTREVDVEFYEKGYPW